MARLPKTPLSKLGRGIYRRGEIYWLAVQQDGRRRFISLETKDPLEAMRRATELRSLPLHRERSRFSEAIVRFLAEKRRLNVFSRATERVHGAALREFAESLGDMPLSAVTPQVAAKHYAHLQQRVRETTAQIHIRALRAFFNWCIKQQLAQANPFGSLQLKKIDQPARVRFCTTTQRDSLIDAAPDADLKFILLAGFDAGLRKNEIIEARTGWFDLKGKALHLQNTDTFRIKDREARAVPLTDRFAAFLAEYLKERRPADFALKPNVSHGRGTYRYDFHRPFNNFMLS